MKIPKKLKIGGHDVKVRFTETMQGDYPNASGGWTEALNLIEIRKSLAGSQKEVTLIHEILHAINYNFTEEQVEFLSQTLYQVLKDNKLYFDGKDVK